MATTRNLRIRSSDLFSPRPLKRLAALGYIAGLAATVELARTLRDFIAWEERTMLRRRASQILHRMETDLDRAASIATPSPSAQMRSPTSHTHPLPLRSRLSS